MLSTLTQGWDDAKADATAAIIRDIGDRQAALDRAWADPLPVAVAPAASIAAPAALAAIAGDLEAPEP